MIGLRRYVYMYTHTHTGILLRHEKNEPLPFAATWIDLENIILSEVSQTKMNIMSLICSI